MKKIELDEDGGEDITPTNDLGHYQTALLTPTEEVKQGVAPSVEDDYGFGEVDINDPNLPVFGQAVSKLGVFKAIPGHHLYWFNDIPGRVEMALACGYRFVKREEVQLSDHVVPRNSDLGDKVSSIVGTTAQGEGQRAYLMKIPTPLYERAQKILQQKPDQIEKSIVNGRFVNRDSGPDAFYVPQDTPIHMNSTLSRRKR